MHSKHLRRTAHHTMSTTYTPRHRNLHPSTTTTNPWATSQAAHIHSLRDISHPPLKKPPVDILTFDSTRQIHASWRDGGLVEALSTLHASLPPQSSLALKYGGRDVTDATWVTVHEISSPPTSSTPTPPSPVLRYVLWFHEYDDLDVEVGELAGREWCFGVKEEEGKDGGGVVKMEEGDGEVAVKMEDVEDEMDGVVKIEDEEV